MLDVVLPADLTRILKSYAILGAGAGLASFRPKPGRASLDVVGLARRIVAKSPITTAHADEGMVEVNVQAGPTKIARQMLVQQRKA